MCKGIQHPTRGLFLRSYLSEMTRDKLPDEGSEYAGEKGGNTRDCIDFVVQNFVEMNKLWVRMQHQGSVRDRDKREQERKELGPLIGKMLSRLSNLEGLNATLYASHVLPVLVDQITNCKDMIAQGAIERDGFRVCAWRLTRAGLRVDRVFDGVYGASVSG